MNKQLDLYEQPETRKRKGPQLARRMIAILHVKKRWTTRAELGMEHGLSPRECRLGRQSAHGMILYSQKGFKLTRHATEDETRKCLETMASQIKALQEEHKQLTKRAHKALAQRGVI